MCAQADAVELAADAAALGADAIAAVPPFYDLSQSPAVRGVIDVDLMSWCGFDLVWM